MVFFIPDIDVLVLAVAHYDELCKHTAICMVSGTLEGRKDMFYLTTHSTHFIYGCMASDMVKYHTNSKRGNPLSPHELLFRLTARVLLYAPSHRQDNTYRGLCYNSGGALAGSDGTLEIEPIWTRQGSSVTGSLEQTMLEDSLVDAYKRTLAANRQE